MSKIVLCGFDFETTFKLIEENILSCVTTKIEVSDYKYHHNAHYGDMPEILRNGILSYNERLRLENKDGSEEEKYRRSDSAYVNGTDFISVATEEGYPADSTPSYRLKYDLYYYDSLYRTDILLSQDIDANPNRHNYINECFVKDKIDISKFRGIDIRLLNYIKATLKNPNERDIKRIINAYNSLIDMSLIMREDNLGIPLREVSCENNTLEISKVSNLQKIK